MIWNQLNRETINKKKFMKIYQTLIENLCHILHMTPVVFPQHRAGAGPTSPRFPVLGTGIVYTRCTFLYSYKSL